ncbi:hypothetical protein evm_009524 [Chilo suppressalis]|nr:hypothetical protein evm_009524 [Chilo suppressalis]
MESKIMIVVFMVVLCAEVVLSMEDGLKEGATGVCTEIVSQQQWFKKTYGCSKKGKRICSKMEVKFVPTKKNICCDGWKFYNGQCIPEGPLCETPCVNAECTGYNICTCYTGYKSKTQFQCEPECGNCENGVCVAPNICECNSGYHNVEDLKSYNESSSCKPYCTSCNNGECIAPDLCRCNEGYERHYNTCDLIPLRNCKGCDATCNESICACANGTICESSTEEAIVSSTPTLAGLQLTWMLGGTIGILLLIFVLVIMHRTWRQRKNFEQKASGDDYRRCDSVMHTIPNTLIGHKYEDDDENEEGVYDTVEHRQTNIDLLPRGPSRDFVERI